jgi:hypothetical protein
VGSLSTGGGSSAVAASAHAGCTRFRHTDPLLIGTTRRALATQLGHPDTAGGIPEARWMRAMTFERLIRNERFVSQLLTTAVGSLGLARPTAVRRVDAKVTSAKTATAIQQAHLKAVHQDVATMITGLAVPFVGMEATAGATPVKPDFAIVAPRHDDPASDDRKTLGSWLIMGDAKDYERVRSRIDDQRMLKGFLQVALGAESISAWSILPADMTVHTWGALAVPRTAFLQPEAVVERIDDHRREVRARVDERAELLRQLANEGGVLDVPAFVAHLEAAFDPAGCSTCPMFSYCRNEIRNSTDPKSLLVELGIPPEQRPALAGLVDGTGVVGAAKADAQATLQASLEGLAQWSGQRRRDPIGLPGTVEIVIAKSDAASLGVHGVSVRAFDGAGARTAWVTHVFEDPQSPDTRRRLMALIGEQLQLARDVINERERVFMGPVFADSKTQSSDPVHLVVPDKPTADLLSSVADSLAGVELSRLRWQRDLDQGRPALTFDGQPATVPVPLTDSERLGVSFLLEEDRARAMTLRCPFVIVQTILAGLITPGGPTADAGRLDYLVQWAEATQPLDHRTVSDAIAASEHTPGARMTNVRSDAIHAAQLGSRASRAAYKRLVREELAYKADVLDRAVTVLAGLEESRLRKAFLALEGAAQEVWRRRGDLHASDLVRFSRTTRPWRNDQVEILDDDASCATKLLALGNVQRANDLATNAGTREVAHATVLALKPLRLHVQSRRIVAGTSIVLLHVNGSPAVESGKTMKIQGGSLKFGQFSVGPLEPAKTAKGTTAPTGSHEFNWAPKVTPNLSVGDRLVIADLAWFVKRPFASGHEIAIDRPSLDKNSAPKETCHDGSYKSDPAAHTWCCRSHEDAEAEYSDRLAERRSRGELNPETWPPLVDEDRFDTKAVGDPDPDESNPGTPPETLTLDDLD